jgi:hypothetical protein
MQIDIVVRTDFIEVSEATGKAVRILFNHITASRTQDGDRESLIYIVFLN